MYLVVSRNSEKSVAKGGPGGKPWGSRGSQRAKRARSVGYQQPREATPSGIRLLHAPWSKDAAEGSELRMRRRELQASEHQTEEVPGRRGGEQDGIDTVEDPPVTGEDAAHVLDPQVALERRFDEVTERSEDRDDQRQADRPGGGEGLDRRNQRDGHQQQAQRRPDGPLPRLRGTHGRRQGPAAPQRPDSVGQDVVQDRQADHRQQE